MSLSRRRTRLRSTAVPTFFETVNPTRTGPPSPRSRTCSTKAAVDHLFCPLAAARKSARCRSRALAARGALISAGERLQLRRDDARRRTPPHRWIPLAQVRQDPAALELSDLGLRVRGTGHGGIGAASRPPAASLAKAPHAGI